MATYLSFSSASTKLFGERYAKKNLKLKGAFVVALHGELGAGKTTFVQGFCKGLGIKKRAVSPTFIIFRKFHIPHPTRFATRSGRAQFTFNFLYHVDAYRLKNLKELAALGFAKMLSDPQNIVLIEWAENIKKMLPKGTLRVRFRHGTKENERIIKYWLGKRAY